MIKRFEGMLLGKGLRFGLVVSRFNEFFSQKLLEGAQDALLRHDVSEEDMNRVHEIILLRKWREKIHQDWEGGVTDIDEDDFNIQ